MPPALDDNIDQKQSSRHIGRSRKCDSAQFARRSFAHPTYPKPLLGAVPRALLEIGDPLPMNQRRYARCPYESPTLCPRSHWRIDPGTCGVCKLGCGLTGYSTFSPVMLRSWLLSCCTFCLILEGASTTHSCLKIDRSQGRLTARPELLTCGPTAKPETILMSSVLFPSLDHTFDWIIHPLALAIVEVDNEEPTRATTPFAGQM